MRGADLFGEAMARQGTGAKRKVLSGNGVVKKWIAAARTGEVRVCEGRAKNGIALEKQSVESQSGAWQWDSFE